MSVTGVLDAMNGKNFNQMGKNLMNHLGGIQIQCLSSQTEGPHDFQIDFQNEEKAILCKRKFHKTHYLGKLIQVKLSGISLVG